jgi:hypothetical protein
VNAPFVRFSRDRGGYEHFYILQAIPDRRGRMRQRVLYWYRTPPQVKVGREPFDEATRRALESQNPDVRFDWEKIRNTPIPPIQSEHWRERRLAERAARQQMAVDEAGTSDAGAGGAPARAQTAAGGPPAESRRGRRRRRRREHPGQTAPTAPGVADAANGGSPASNSQDAEASAEPAAGPSEITGWPPSEE